MQNDAGAAEWVEEAAFFGAFGGEVDENLGKLWRKHTNESVAGGASLVALGVLGNILRANRGRKGVAKFDEFDMIEFFAKLIVVSGGARDDGGLARDKANIAAVALEEIFVLQCERPGGFLAGFGGVIADAEGDFAFWELAEVVGRGFIEDFRNFECAAEAVDINEFGGDDS